MDNQKEKQILKLIVTRRDRYSAGILLVKFNKIFFETCLPKTVTGLGPTFESRYKIINKKTPHKGESFVCEPSGFRVEHLFESILKTYTRLQELGFTYYNGKIVVIDVEEVKND